MVSHLVELLGKDMAKDYRPLVDFIIDENKKLHEAEQEAKQESKKATKQAEKM